MWPQIPVTARSKTCVCARSLVWIAGSNPAGGMVVSYECFVLSGRGLFDGPIYRPGESCHMHVCVSLSVIRCNNDPLHLTLNRSEEIRIRTKGKGLMIMRSEEGFDNERLVYEKEGTELEL